MAAPVKEHHRWSVWVGGGREGGGRGGGGGGGGGESVGGIHGQWEVPVVYLECQCESKDSCLGIW